jgi:hypothetical protein
MKVRYVVIPEHSDARLGYWTLETARRSAADIALKTGRPASIVTPGDHRHIKTYTPDDGRRLLHPQG